MPLINAELVAPDPPVMLPVTDGANQLYTVPAGIIPSVPSTGDTLYVIPLQVTAVIAVIEAFGLIVTVTVNVAPVQTPVNGVTV